jgi:hypothetical protein
LVRRIAAPELAGAPVTRFIAPVLAIRGSTVQPGSD